MLFSSKRNKTRIKSNNQQKSELSSEELFQSLIDDYTSSIKSVIVQKQQSGRLPQRDFMDDVVKHMNTYYHATKEASEEALQRFEQYMFGYSRLTPLIEDPGITDIHCISYNNIWYKKKGIRYKSDIRFKEASEYESFIDFVATKNHANISNMNAIQRFSDIHTSEVFSLRFSLTMPLVNMLDEPYLHIRKTLKDFPEMDDLVKKGMMSPEMADELIRRFGSGSTLICGANSAGKTSLLNALKETLPENMSVMIVQQTDELSTKRTSPVMLLHSLPGSGETEISYELDKTSEAGLTMDVDFFILGEIKGKEASYVLNAAYSGQLCAATIHSHSAPTAADKICDYSMHQGNYTKEQLMKMYCCFKNVVFLEKYKVTQLYEIAGWNEEKKEIDYIPVYVREAADENS